MSKLADDSVICAYIHMLGKTQLDLKLPEYSEIYLRLALIEICGKNFVLSTDILQLYRKLLALYYCEEYPSLTPAITIMERCFVKEELYSIINEKKYVLGKWLEFQNYYTAKRATLEKNFVGGSNSQ